MTLGQLIRLALAEDIGSGDITSELLIPSDNTVTAHIVARSSGILAGIKVCAQVFKTVDRRTKFEPFYRDGSRFRRGAVLARVFGPARAILAGERTALNFLSHLSGIATFTDKFVTRVKGSKAVILDTRKTLPGWRALEKYAVRCGGGKNHRQGLYDMVLIKDNHIKIVGGVKEALARCYKCQKPVEIEVKTLEELRAALTAGARRVMLDNMTLPQLKKAVKIVAGRAKLEVSGGVNLKNVKAIARIGVDYISIGAITHSAPAADISLEVVES
ncbi:MAG: carboxylating nicotinate-nucleotide diphosphorylase [candidate division WOR-3 bacterium]